MKHLFTASVLLVAFPLPAVAQPPQAPNPGWTREQAFEQLSLHPHDLYLQFVAAQLSDDPQAAAQLQSLIPRPLDRRQIGRQRNSQVNLYSIFSGSLAVQESLQLDAMTGTGSVGTNEPLISVTTLSGPTVKSHPWEKMLGNQTPNVSRLAQCVPEDHLFIRFESISKLMEMRDVADDWYAYSMGQANGSVRSKGNMSRLQKQLLMETSGLLKPLYDTAFAEVAITSSDLFFGEGTDATLIMRLNQPELVRTALDQMLQLQVSQNRRAKLETGAFLDIPFTHVTTADRSVHVFAADPTADLHVRSNSRVAFERIMRTVLNKPTAGQTIKRLSESDEFRYIRTLMPSGAQQEDGFVYLSDPFIRNLIGPEKKLTQRNRLVCRSQLQILRHAQLLYLTQHGSAATSIDQLRRGDCLGNRQTEMDLQCPSGGEYTLLDGRMQCRCSHHGSPDAMIPTCEILVEDVPKSHADEYRQFVEEYSRYWQTFFDPIAVRIQLEPSRTRIETIVLPLINNSIYTGLADTLGGKPEHLDALPVPETNIASLAVKIDKHKLLEQMGIQHPDPDSIAKQEPKSTRESPAEFANSQIEQSLKQIGLGLHNHHSAYGRLPPRPEVGSGLDPTSRLSWRVQILPFLEEQALYARFRLDEAWDSEHNLPLAKEIPGVYASGSAELAKQGKTRFVFPQHPDAMYQGTNEGAKFRDVRDGLSNTIMLTVANDAHAVAWTKPDDLQVDLKNPREGLYLDENKEARIALADGVVAKLPRQFSNRLVAGLLTRAGGEILQEDLTPVRVDNRDRFSNRRSSFPDRDRLVKELSLDRFLHQGIGNQIAIHVCDDTPLVDFNVSRMFGMFSGPGRFLSADSSMYAVMALAINTPVYVSVPVTDAEIVDDTLEKLDRFLAKVARTPNNQFGGFLQIEQDAYQFSGSIDPKVRAYAFRFGPLTWRFYWLRIGDGLYIASTPNLIGDLRAAATRNQKAGQKEVDTEAAHAMLRIRPEHWREIKSHFRIGWAESERRACLNNLSPLSNTAKAILHSNQGEASLTQSRQLAEDLFDGPLICPTHGRHIIDAETGRVSCSLHGTAAAPEQPLAKHEGVITTFAESLEDVRLELTFLEDGLHAVVTVDTKAGTNR